MPKRTYKPGQNLEYLEAGVNMEKLISLVEMNAVIWDRTLDNYQDRILCRHAWSTICSELNPNFTKLNPEDQENYTKLAIKKWANVRDQWLKWYKMTKAARLAGFKSRRKFVHEKAIKFLKKTQQDCQDDSDCEEPEPDKSLTPDSDEELLELRLMTAIEARIVTEDNRHLMFFKGILPSLQNFSEKQTLEFQLGILQLIQKLSQGP